MEQGATAIRQRARWLLEDRSWVSPLVASSGVVEGPLTINDGAGNPERWFVPVVVGEQLVGYFVFGLDGVVHRWSTFQRRPDSLDGCPAAADWLDPDTITSRARDVAGRQPTGRPVLGYDDSPDRLAWRVPVGDRTVAVAGTAAWWA
jgi:hypothetical protein